MSCNPSTLPIWRGNDIIMGSHLTIAMRYVVYRTSKRKPFF